MIYVNLSSLAWAACAALFVARYLHPWLTRAMDLHEARYAIAPLTHTPADPIPDDLLGYVNEIHTGNAEMDSMMREQTLSVLYEQYATLGDWDAVRAWSATHMQQDTRSDGWGNH